MQYRTNGLINPRSMDHLPAWADLRAKYASADPNQQQTIDYLQYLPSDVTMMGNDGYGDCFEAMLYHGDQLRTLELTGTIQTASTDRVLSTYSAITGFNRDNTSTDVGTDPEQAINWLLKNGLPRDDGSIPLRAAINLDKSNLENCIQALDYCGGLGLGIVFPQRLIDMETMPLIWDWQNGDILSNDGHAIYCGRMSPDGQDIGILSWGIKYAMQKPFWDNCVIMVIALIFDDWAQAGKTPFGITLDQLDAEMTPLAGGSLS